MIFLVSIFSLLFSCIISFFSSESLIALFLLLFVSNRSTDGTIIISGLTVAFIIQCLRVNFFEKNKTFWFIILLFIGYHIAVLVIAPYKIQFSYFISYINALLMFILTMSINWNREKIIKFVSAYTALLVIYGLIEFVTISPPRIAGPLYFATIYAVVLVIVWIVWFTDAVLSQKSIKKIIFVTFFVLLVVLLSGTRMGLLGMALGVFLAGLSKILVVSQKKSIFIKIVTGIIVAILIFIAIFIIWKLIPDDLIIKKNFNSILSMKLDNSNLGRIIAWVTAIDIIPKHILWGIGPNNFNIYIQQFLQSNGIQQYFFLPHAHNIFLIILSEHGVIGLIVFGLIVFLCEFKLFYQLLRGTQSSIIYALANGFIVIIFMGMFDATPLTLGTLCFGGWFMGVSAKISEFAAQEKNFFIIKISNNEKNKNSII